VCSQQSWRGTARGYSASAMRAGSDAHDKLAPADRIIAVDHVPLYVNGARRARHVDGARSC